MGFWVLLRVLCVDHQYLTTLRPENGSVSTKASGELECPPVGPDFREKVEDSLPKGKQSNARYFRWYTSCSLPSVVCTDRSMKCPHALNGRGGPYREAGELDLGKVVGGGCVWWVV